MSVTSAVLASVTGATGLPLHDVIAYAGLGVAITALALAAYGCHHARKRLQDSSYMYRALCDYVGAEESYRQATQDGRARERSI